MTTDYDAVSRNTTELRLHAYRKKEPVYCTDVIVIQIDKRRKAGELRLEGQTWQLREHIKHSALVISN